MNAFREKRGRPPLAGSPGVRFLNYGKNREGYWGCANMAEQLTDMMDAHEALHNDWQVIFEVDWSSGHAAYSPGSLNVNTMGVFYGGTQQVPRDSVIPEDPREAAMYLGEYEAKMEWKGKVRREFET